MINLSFQTMLGTRAGQALKQPLRAVVAKAGYDLVPVTRDDNRRLQEMLVDSGVATVIDVGANQGQFAAHVRSMGFKGEILSFEPGLAAHRLLARHAAMDPMWHVRQCALGAEPGTLQLNVAHNSVSSSLYNVADQHVASAPASATKSVENVSVSRLDDETAELTGDFWLKIDTQGYELQVLLGAEQSLKRTKILQLEVSLIHLYDGQPDWLDLMSFIKARGFTTVDVLPGFRSPTGDLLQCDVLAKRQ